MFPVFPFTQEGFVQAKQWLEFINKWDSTLEKEDGYTVVATANYWFDKARTNVNAR